jgi:hypothetical protein
MNRLLVTTLIMIALICMTAAMEEESAALDEYNEEDMDFDMDVFDGEEDMDFDMDVFDENPSRVLGSKSGRTTNVRNHHNYYYHVNRPRRRHPLQRRPVWRPPPQRRPPVRRPANRRPPTNRTCRDGRRCTRDSGKPCDL